MSYNPLTMIFPAVLAGALFLSGNAAAQTFDDAPVSDPLIEQGREAFLNYDFQKARDAYSRYAAQQRKARKETDPELETLLSRLDNAERQLERVQDIVIIDSIAVRASDFFKNIRIPASAGYLLPPSEIPFAGGRGAASMAFTPESQAVMLWAEPDSTGTFRIMESLRLADGSYAAPVMASDILNAGGDVDFPVLCADGLTLYFSSDGENSIGGYDIFETVRDARTGEYLPPSNVGMPFNSPYDDFLLVADEENGVGWWATDRNNLGDYITLYVYMLPEMRRNFDGDEQERISRARIDDYHATWTRPDSSGEDDEDEGNEDVRQPAMTTADYVALAAEIRRIKPGQRPKAAEFYLPAKGGKVYTRYDQLPDAASRAAVKAYNDALAKFNAQQTALDDDRRKYDKSRDKSLGLRILQQEEALEQSRKKLKDLLSAIYKGLR